MKQYYSHHDDCHMLLSLKSLQKGVYIYGVAGELKTPTNLYKAESKYHRRLLNRSRWQHSLGNIEGQNRALDGLYLVREKKTLNIHAPAKIKRVKDCHKPAWLNHDICHSLV